MVPSRIALLLVFLLLGVGSASGAAPRFTIPYDVEAAPGGVVFIADGGSGRVLRYHGGSRTLTIYATIRRPEIVGIARGGDGTLYVSDIQGGIVWKIDIRRRLSQFARVPAANDSLIRNGTLYVGSIENGVYAVDLRTRRTRLLARLPGVHGLAYDRAAGSLVASVPPTGLVRVDPRTGATSPVLSGDVYRPAFGPDGRLYVLAGNPAGGTVRRLEDDGSLTVVAGTGRTGPEGENVPATSVGMQIGAIAFARDGALLIGQIAPKPAKIRRVDLATGTITTLVRSG
jgi:hypothetical protein